MPYAVGSACFSTVSEAVAVAVANFQASQNQADLRLIGWQDVGSIASVYRINADGSGALLQVSLPLCAQVNTALPVVVGSNSVSLPLRSYGSDAGYYAMTSTPGSAYAQIPADVASVGGFLGIGFATVVGLYWFSYAVGQVVDLVKNVR